MILSRLKLENFKQFREVLDLEPPEGAVGVVGANGSGKTTLFEAILWAFFGSRAGGPRFSNDSIPWSGGSVADRSLVEVTLDVAGSEYTVSRSLHRNKTQAFVYDGSGREVTGGPSEVVRWVQEELLGMDRVAFDATFFARQKELEFFSGVEGVARQREVARILGIDQVEKAQKLLRSDRNDLKSEVNAIEQMLADTDHEALAKDLGEARERRAELEVRAKELRSAFEKSTETLEKARAESKRLEDLYRRHNDLSRGLGKATAERDRLVERVAELEGRLRGLGEDQKTVAELEPKVTGLAAIEAEIEKLEESRRREERLESARKELGRVRREAHNAVMEAADLIERLPADDELLPGWSGVFRPEDELDQARLAAKLLEGADPAHERAAAHLESLKETGRLHEERSLLKGRLEKAASYIEETEAEIQRLDAEVEGLTGGGSLDKKIADLRVRRDGLQGESARQRGYAEAGDREAQKLAKAREMIEASDEHAKCPTCQRGYEEDEHAEVISSLRRQEDELSRRAREARDERRKLDEKAAATLKEIETSETARSKAHKLGESRAASTARHKSYLEKRDELASQAEDLDKRLSGAKPPTPEQLEVFGRSVARLGELRDARPKLLGLLSSNDRSRATAAERQGEVDLLSAGEPYNGERHTELGERRSEIQTVKGRIEALRSKLKERPEVERLLSETKSSRLAAANEVERLESELKRLGFDEESHARAGVAASEAERLRDETREKRDESERELRSVEGAVENLQRELGRHEKQREAADTKGVEVSSLGSMDGLFTEFYRELTARVRPRLQDEASELVGTLTEGRYERMELDENYGVRLYDGLSDAYEVSRFSGGEADVASLCARVALSKMISGKGSGALGFIVLDEVFGALDASRRRNVLFALDRLKQTFGQIFVISHVADVQESPLLDETWLIEEDDEGKSSLRVVRHDPLETSEVSGNPDFA